MNQDKLDLIDRIRDEVLKLDIYDNCYSYYKPFVFILFLYDKKTDELVSVFDCLEAAENAISQFDEGATVAEIRYDGLKYFTIQK